MDELFADVLVQWKCLCDFVGLSGSSFEETRHGIYFKPVIDFYFET